MSIGGASLAALAAACSPGSRSSRVGTVSGAPLHYRTLLDVARQLESREISAVELAGHMLERISVVDRTLKSYATVTAERALAAARAADDEIASGLYRGPLHGVPVAVKDLCYTRGIRTMGGLGAFRDFTPGFDATVVARLESAGAVLLGKLNLTEGAMAGYHPDFDIPVNPWDDTLWSGASSSGSGVATAAGLCFASLGTDTGGSIRFPSMANGTVGLKPTYGRVSRHGVMPLAESLDHVGPMSRSVADAAVVLAAIAGHDENDPTSLRDPVPDMLAELDSGIDGLRIGIDRRFCSEGVVPGLVEAIEGALDVLGGLGAHVVDVAMPAHSQELADAWFTICAAEAYRAHAATLAERGDAYGPFFRDFCAMGADVSDEQYSAAAAVREGFNERFRALLSEADAVVCPAGGVTFPIPADQYGDAETLQPLFDAVQMRFTIPADLAGTPTLTVPCGASPSGVPYVFQFMGPRLSEPLLCRIGHAYERATGWHERHPPV